MMRTGININPQEEDRGYDILVIDPRFLEFIFCLDWFCTT